MKNYNISETIEALKKLSKELQNYKAIIGGVDQKKKLLRSLGWQYDRSQNGAICIGFDFDTKNTYLCPFCRNKLTLGPLKVCKMKNIETDEYETFKSMYNTKVAARGQVTMSDDGLGIKAKKIQDLMSRLDELDAEIQRGDTTNLLDVVNDLLKHMNDNYKLYSGDDFWDQTDSEGLTNAEYFALYEWASNSTNDDPKYLDQIKKCQ